MGNINNHLQNQGHLSKENRSANPTVSLLLLASTDPTPVTGAFVQAASCLP